MVPDGEISLREPTRNPEGKLEYNCSLTFVRKVDYKGMKRPIRITRFCARSAKSRFIRELDKNMDT
jgi:hypothetical protein